MEVDLNTSKIVFYKFLSTKETSEVVSSTDSPKDIVIVPDSFLGVYKVAFVSAIA